MHGFRRSIGVMILAASALAQNPLQNAPVKAANRTNPFEESERARVAGAKIFARECAACHGAKGQGIGKAPALNRPAVSDAPAGALFWVMENGSLRSGMPSFAHLPEAQRWQIVTFLRSLNSASRREPEP
jgi:mono/diheme cytochrome c family protein